MGPSVDLGQLGQADDEVGDEQEDSADEQPVGGTVGTTVTIVVTDSDHESLDEQVENDHTDQK